MITRINPPELGSPPGYFQIVEVKVERIIFAKSYVQGTREKTCCPSCHRRTTIRSPSQRMSIRLS